MGSEDKFTATEADIGRAVNLSYTNVGETHRGVLVTIHEAGFYRIRLDSGQAGLVSGDFLSWAEPPIIKWEAVAYRDDGSLIGRRIRGKVAATASDDEVRRLARAELLGMAVADAFTGEREPEDSLADFSFAWVKYRHPDGHEVQFNVLSNGVGY